MNWETIKEIYVEVLKHGAKFEYLGGDKYSLTEYYENGNKYREVEYQNRQVIRFWVVITGHSLKRMKKD